MHEHGLADHILETVLAHPDRPQQAVPRAITVLVAELGGISQDALQANLDHVCEHHELPRIELRVESVPLLGCCKACQETSPLGEELICPACGSAEVRLCGGETIVISTCDYTQSSEPMLQMGLIPHDR